MPAGWVSAGLGLYSLLNNSGGGSGGGPTYSGGTGGAPLYVPTGQNSADQQWQQMLAQLYGQTSGTAASANQYFQNALSGQANVNTAGLLPAATQAAGQYTDLAGLYKLYQQMLQGQAEGNFGQQDALRGAGNAAFATSMDPQNALYNRTLGRVQDASRASSSAHGVAMSPYAAGLEDQSVSNFNIDWENQQLARMLSALQGMSGATGVSNQTGQLGGADLSGAAGFSSQIPGATLAAAQAPIDAQWQQYQYPATAASNYVTNMNSTASPVSGLMAGIIPYLNYGAGAGATAGNFQAGNRNFNASQQALGAGGLMYGLNSLGQNYNTPGTWLNSFNSSSSQPYNYNTYGYGGGSSNFGSNYNNYDFSG